LSATKYCSPKCGMFKCGKKSVIFRGNSAWCRWTDEYCEVSTCSYALCAKRRLLPNGVCGETLKRKTVETSPEEVPIPSVKLKGRALRKIGDKDLFY